MSKFDVQPLSWIVKEQKLEQALKTILFKCHKRKMVKNPMPIDEFWKDFKNDPNLELAHILEEVGDIAYDVLKETNAQ